MWIIMNYLYVRTFEALNGTCFLQNGRNFIFEGPDDFTDLQDGIDGVHQRHNYNEDDEDDFKALDTLGDLLGLHDRYFAKSCRVIWIQNTNRRSRLFKVIRKKTHITSLRRKSVDIKCTHRIWKLWMNYFTKCKRSRFSELVRFKLLLSFMQNVQKFTDFFLYIRRDWQRNTIQIKSCSR